MTRPKLLLASCLIPLALVACGNGAGVAPVTIPFAVDDLFSASGYFGDGQTPGLLADGACATRAGKGEGKCHSFSWTPPATGSVGYAGVYWLYPMNNFTAPGKAIPAGAKSISFWAWGAKGGETAKFFAGIQAPDGFYVEAGPITLTSTPTQYYLNMQSVTYTTVAGGFGWDTNSISAGGTTTINIDDIEWLDTAPVGNIPGCIDAMAANYNAGATSNDGSCLYNVTFQVDLTGNDPAGGEVPQIDASFNGYCNGCNALTKSATGDVWTSKLPLAPGTYQFKYARNAASPPAYEMVPATCSADASLPAGDRTRSLTVTAAAQTLPVVHFGSCN
jgi:hypothetical protein